jgi:hypothetical protein
MSLRKLKASELPAYRAEALQKQHGKCALTGWTLRPEDAVADHCHKTGLHRAILAGWANSTLGRVENWAGRIGGNMKPSDFLRRCAAYIDYFEANPTEYLHHTHKTPDEKKEAARLKRNKAARAKTAAKRAIKEAT